MAGVIAAGVLCAIALIAHAQATAPVAVGADRKAPVGPAQSKVLADPDTKMYSVCTTGDEHRAPGETEPQYKRPPKAEVMTEEEAKARGYRAGAHKVPCS